ncbi:acetyl-CoA carboxylase biotin carboxyl carrier protein subunit [Hymenobacter aerilatus]|uniref:Acetyl-CoA carboxylase biotin carboxyl carrier protein subunit n=1 Tax=Hymenobacter aerilatus TaxID=2932251 RepID=A0A8T9SYN9_9BACT|nr:acetyl-CoA carboxylase biotin carboxyl carrier protein subunit [Hymenobacter aerilatus]UOR05340.1 acetyl-CoA carboxylase biotin carboxyl carrier protein subunit [Hymenobacter aerilatus]
MLQVQTSPTQIWEVDFRANGNSMLNGEPFIWDIVALGQQRYHILYRGSSFVTEVLEADYATKTLRLQLNGQVVDIQAKDRFDLLLDKLGMGSAASHKINELKAPMPGLIVDVRVAPGQTVQKGDPLLVLEAMKMENILKSPSDGTVTAIKVQMRDNVTKGQVLIQFS